MNKKYIYQTAKFHPDLLDDKLNEYGKDGYKFIQCIVVNEVKHNIIKNELENFTFFMCVFEKEIFPIELKKE
jgi:hypothetical protein